MLELINAARTNPASEGRFLDGIQTPYAVQARRDSPSYFTNLIGEFSSYPTVPPLAFHPILIGTARAHSKDMVAKKYFAHNSPDGMGPADRILKAGYEYDFAGENIAGMGVSSAADCLECHYGLMIDNNNIEDAISHLGHRLNILDRDFTEIGIGYAGTRSGGDATEDFGTPSQPAAYIVGVAYADTNTNSFYDPGEGRSNITVTPDAGSRYAVTSASGGFAIPIEAVETNSDTIQVPFDLQFADWTDVEPYDASYRQARLSNTTTTDIRLVWTGGGLSDSYQSTVRCARPVLIQYQIIGTDDYYYDRKLLTAANIKADLVLDRGGTPVPGRGVNPLRSPQTLSFTNLPATVAYTNGLALNLTGTSSSGLPLGYQASPAKLASVDATNGLLRILGAGTITITASQSGDATHLPAPNVIRSLVVTRGAGSVSFSPLGSVTYSPGSKIPLKSICSANLTATYSSSVSGVAKVSGNNLLIMGAGTTVVTASIPQTANFTAASARQSLLVTRAPQNIVFPAITNDFSKNKTITLKGTSSSGLPVSFASSDTNVLSISGAKATMKRRGNVFITAKQSGSVNFLPATPVTNSLSL